MVSLNFRELLDAAGPTGDVPDGTYDAECSQAEAKMSSTGKPMIVARFKIISGPQANNTIFNNFVISEGNQNALRWFFQHMAVFGMSRDYFLAIDSLDTAAANMVGKVARLTVATKEGRQNVSKITPVPGGTVPLAQAPQQAYQAPQAPAPQMQMAPQQAAPPLQTGGYVQQPAATPLIQETALPPQQVQPQQAALPQDFGTAGQALTAAGQGLDQFVAQTPPEQQPIQYTQVGVPEQPQNGGQPTPDAPPQIPF